MMMMIEASITHIIIFNSNTRLFHFTFVDVGGIPAALPDLSFADEYIWGKHWQWYISGANESLS